MLFRSINCIIAICKIFISMILSEFVFIYIVTYILKVPYTAIIDNYTISGAIYTLPSLLIMALIILGIEFCTNKIKERFLIEE